MKTMSSLTITSYALSWSYGSTCTDRHVAHALVADLVVALEHDQNVLARGDVVQQGDDRLGRGLVPDRERVDDVDASAAGPVGERSAQGGRDHLLGGALRVVARVRSVDDATAGHLGRADRALAGATGSLLLERLAAGSGNLAATQRVVRSLAGGGALRDDHLVDQRDVGLHIERVGGQVDGADVLALRVDDVQLRVSGVVADAMVLRPLHCVADEDDPALGRRERRP